MFCHFSVILFLVPLFSSISFISPVAHSKPVYIGMFFRLCFLLLFCLVIIPDVDSMHFVSLLLLHVERL